MGYILNQLLIENGLIKEYQGVASDYIRKVR
jgi:hypothetical protein